uniref:Bulb-type lectin domain-containing protein n=1 Tax=candidate division WOR-3 bacterium TaxID=2052148 RepID=A0A7C4CC48_UNCW3
MCVDGAGNVYVTGAGESTGMGWDYLTVKCNSAGVLQWHDRYNGAANGEDRANSVCVDGSGNVAVAVGRSTSGDLYATGWSVGTSDNADILTMKVSAAGALVWTARYAAPENGSDIGLRIAVDVQGNPRVLGRVQTGAGGSYDGVTLGYRTDSVSQFTNRLNSGGYGEPGGLALDHDGNAIVCGSYYPNYLVLQYNGPTEVWRWTRDFGSGDLATAVGLDDSGYVYVTGRGDFGADAWDFVTVKLNRNAGIEETPGAEVRAAEFPTICRGMLNLSALGAGRATLVAADGRRVMELRPGANDVRHLAPGVCFVAARPGAMPSGRVVITR